MTPAIQIESATNSFGSNKVLQQVSFSVPKGVVFALLGENGAGKSTLIRGMLGYQRFDSGSVNVLGMEPSRQTMDLRRAVGYVSDAPGLYDWMTVAEAGWYASGFYPEGFIERYEELVIEFGLPPQEKIRDLSKGNRAKVALSLAVAFDPELLVLDEPTSGLDPVVRRSFLESMIDRAAAGKTVFLSSHQIHEVERVADWVAIIHQGHLQVVAELDDLKSQVRLVSFAHHDAYVAAPVALNDANVLWSKQDGRLTTCMIHHMPASLEQQLRSDSNLFDVKVMRPNLEELYLGFTNECAESTASTSKLTASGKPKSDVA